MARYVQTTFAGGELSPQLYGRLDLAWYYNAVSLMDNMYSLKFGGARKRPGFQFIEQTKDNSPVRLIGFKVASNVSYMMEFGDQYIRFFFGAGPVEQRDQPQVHFAEISTPFTADVLYELRYAQSKDVMYITHKTLGIFKLRRQTETTFDLVEMDYKWGPFKSENTQPYFITVTSDTGLTEINSVDYARGFGVINWDGAVDTPIEFFETVPLWNRSGFRSNNADFSVIKAGDTVVIEGTPPTTNDGTYEIVSAYQSSDGYFNFVTANDDDFVDATVSTGLISFSGGEVYPAQDIFKPEDVGALLRLRELPVTEHDEWEPYRRDDYTGDVLDYEEGQTATYENNVYTNISATGPSGRRPPTHGFGVKPDGEAPLDFLEWEYKHEDKGYLRITEYVSPTQVLGEVIETIPTSYTENGNYLWSFSYWGPGLDETGEFSGGYGYPNAIGFHQGRLFFAATPEFPQTVWSSQSDDYENFKVEFPTEDDDGITYFLDSRLLSEIEHLLHLGELIVYTNGTEWKIMPQGDNILTPASVGAFTQSFIGSGRLPPLLIDNDSIFLDTAQRRVYSFGYNFSNDKYLGDDLSIKADHLFSGHYIIDWTYAREPNDIVWMVRDDGVLIGLTYMPTQEVFAWHQHHTDGFVESVEAVTYAGYDVIYIVVLRIINGEEKRYIEIMQTDNFTNEDDAFYVDSGLTYDGRIQGKTGDASVTASAYPDTAILTTTFLLVANDIGRTLVDSDGTRYEIRSLNTEFEAVVIANRDQDGGAIFIEGIMAQTFSALEHLEGKAVTVLGDGCVYEDDLQNDLIVTSGQITLEQPVLVAQIGLPYEAHLETLDLDVSTQSGSNQGRKNNVQDVMLRVVNSRDILVGPNSEQLNPLKARSDEEYQEPPYIKNGDYIITSFPQWKDSARVHVANKTPTPLELSLMAPRVSVGGS